VRAHEHRPDAARNTAFPRSRRVVDVRVGSGAARPDRRDPTAGGHVPQVGAHETHEDPR
jgi:hypothetical protein